SLLRPGRPWKRPSFSLRCGMGHTCSLAGRTLGPYEVRRDPWVVQAPFSTGMCMSSRARALQRGPDTYSQARGMRRMDEVSDYSTRPFLRVNEIFFHGFQRDELVENVMLAP